MDFYFFQFNWKQLSDGNMIEHGQNNYFSSAQSPTNDDFIHFVKDFIVHDFDATIEITIVTSITREQYEFLTGKPFAFAEDK